MNKITRPEPVLSSRIPYFRKVLSTAHHVYHKSAQNMDSLADHSVNLVVTSPPYPMIAMWDESFCAQDPAIADLLNKGKGPEAFEKMHQVMDVIWKELARVLKPGGMVAINIGDATRTLDSNFSLYSNHTRILKALETAGFSSLPPILWRKPTNSPNKFMGSGMLPAGAYVTLEHEYILLFRKGKKRAFTQADEKENRQRSAYFWEERNRWFSDLWEFTGTRQKRKTTHGRERSGAFPFELPWRLIHMFSVQGDLVLDPFLGTGTTSKAALLAGRSSVGFEREASLTKDFLQTELVTYQKKQVNLLEQRFQAHQSFIAARTASHGPESFKHQHQQWKLPVMTSQETTIQFPKLTRLSFNSPQSFTAQSDWYQPKSELLING